MKAARGVLSRMVVSVGGVELAPAEDEEYEDLVGGLLAKGPLVMLLDEAQNFDPDCLARVLYRNYWLIRHKYPLATVIAGTPGLERNLRKDELVSADIREEIYTGALSDEVTREALRVPFEQAGVSGGAPKRWRRWRR